MRTRKSKKKIVVTRCPTVVADSPNSSWSMDFTSDSLCNGRRFRTLNVIDDCTRESLGIEAGFSLPSHRVIQVLDYLVWLNGKPKQITCDNGPEFRASRTQVSSTLSSLESQCRMPSSSPSTENFETSA